MPTEPKTKTPASLLEGFKSMMGSAGTGPLPIEDGLPVFDLPPLSEYVKDKWKSDRGVFEEFKTGMEAGEKHLRGGIYQATGEEFKEIFGEKRKERTYGAFQDKWFDEGTTVESIQKRQTGYEKELESLESGYAKTISKYLKAKDKIEEVNSGVMPLYAMENMASLKMWQKDNERLKGQLPELQKTVDKYQGTYDLFHEQKAELERNIQKSKSVGKTIEKEGTAEDAIRVGKEATERISGADKLVGRGKEIQDAAPEGYGFWYETGMFMPQVAGTMAAIGASYFTGGTSMAMLPTILGTANSLALGQSVVGNTLYEYDKYIEEHGMEEDPINKWGVALGSGAVELLMEQMHLGRYLPKGAFGKVFAKTVIKESPDFGTKLMQKFAKDQPVQYQKFIKGIANYAKSSNEEGMEEFFTQIFQDWFANSYKNPEDKAKWDEIAMNSLKAYKGGAMMGGMLGPASYHANQHYDELRRNQHGIVLTETKEHGVVELIGKRKDGDYSGKTAKGKNVRLSTDDIGPQLNLSKVELDNYLDLFAEGQDQALDLEIEIVKKNAADQFDAQFSQYKHNVTGNLHLANDIEGNMVYIVGHVDEKLLIIADPNTGEKKQVAKTELEDVQEMNYDQAKAATIETRMSEYEDIKQHEEGARTASQFEAGEKVEFNGREFEVSGVDVDGIQLDEIVEEGMGESFVLPSEQAGELTRVVEQEKETAEDRELQTFEFKLDDGYKVKANENEDGSFTIDKTFTSEKQAKEIQKKLKEKFGNRGYVVDVTQENTDPDNPFSDDLFTIQVSTTKKEGKEATGEQETGVEETQKEESAKKMPEKEKPVKVKEKVLKPVEVLREELAEMRERQKRGSKDKGLPGQILQWEEAIKQQETKEKPKKEEGVKEISKVEPKKDPEKLTNLSNTSTTQEIKAEVKKVDTNPSEAKIEAGNYAKGHIKWNGLDISIENPKGSERSGTDDDGKKWSVKMKSHYGYFKRTEGKDGDQVDVLLGDKLDSDNVFVVDQVNEDGTFDEHKVMVGFNTEEEAKKGYLANYEEGWTGLGAITQMTGEDFKTWLGNATRTKKPVSKDIKVLTKTQEQKVKETLTEGGEKHIKDIAEETGIVEPNVRRILGVGTKKGKFERVDKGVYKLTTEDGKTHAWIHSGDAVDVLPKLAKEGFKADMVFLDIPYNTSGIKSGNRELIFDKITPDKFRKVVNSLSDIVQDENSPIIFMHSTSSTGMKDMQAYIDVISEQFKPVAKGFYTKYYKNGNRVNMPMRKDKLPPEALILMTKSGEFSSVSKELNLDFDLVRPRGYPTEKPAELLKEIIEMTTYEGDMVLDPFAGSGVTGAEAVKAGRDATLIEKSEDAVEDVVKPRVEKGAKEKPIIPKKQKLSAEDTKKLINRVVGLAQDYNKIPASYTSKRRTVLQSMMPGMGQLGYSYKMDGKKLIIVDKSGKVVKKIADRTPKEEVQAHKALNEYENTRFIELVEDMISSPALLIGIDTGLNINEIRSAINNISQNKKTVISNKLLDYMEQSFNEGVFKYKQTQTSESFEIPLNRIVELMFNEKISKFDKEYGELVPHNVDKAVEDGLLTEGEKQTFLKDFENETEQEDRAREEYEQSISRSKEDISEAGPHKSQARGEQSQEVNTKAKDQALTVIDEKIAEKKETLSNLRKQREKKYSDLNTRNGLFGDTDASFAGSLFDNTKQFEPTKENIASALKPIDTQIAGLEKEIADLEKSKETAGKEAGGQKELKKLPTGVKERISKNSAEVQLKEIKEKGWIRVADPVAVSNKINKYTNAETVADIESSTVKLKDDGESFAGSVLDEQIESLEKEIKQKEKTAKYLQGGKKGAWGLPTQADSKRSDEISNLKNRLNSLKSKPTNALIVKIEGIHKKGGGRRLSEIQEAIAKATNIEQLKSLLEIPFIENDIDLPKDINGRIQYLQRHPEETNVKKEEPFAGNILKPKEEKPTEKVPDFIGDYIGGARKDLAISGQKKLGKSKTGPAWRKDYRVLKNEDGTFTAMKSRNNYIQWKAPSSAKTEEDAETQIKLHYVLTKYGIWKTHQKDTFEVYRRVTSRKRHTMKDDFKTKEDAEKWLATNIDYLVSFKPQFPERPHIEDLQRTGSEHRKGNVSFKDLQKTFGFKGGEFGNWIPQDERQRLLNFAYDGLMDMANILGVPSLALSLNGDLSLAFGARGHGLTGAAAHYERDRAVFNLTRMRGAGSVAHEWFHALDHYLGFQDKGKTFEKDEKGKVISVTKLDRDFLSHGKSYKSQARAELIESFTKLIETIYKQPKIIEVSVERFAERKKSAEVDLDRSIKGIRDYITKDRDWGRKKKAATPEQLKRFDALIEKVMKGNLGKEATIESKSRMAFGGFKTSQVYKDLNDLLTEITGRGYYKRSNQGYMSGWVYDLEYTRARLIDAIEQLKKYTANNKEERLTPTKYYYDAKDIDAMRASDYWTTEHEMAARAFEAYIEDKLDEAGVVSQYLVHSTSGGFYKVLYGLNPYPEGGERKTINKAFESFFKTVKTKEEDGRVAIYRKTSKNYPIKSKGSFNIVSTGDVVVGDHVKFERDIWGGTWKKPKHLGTETIEAIVIRDSYGKDKQQHTFTLEVYDGSELRIKGRNLYKHGVFRKKWRNEDERKTAIEEKHDRGDMARKARDIRKSNDTRYKLKDFAGEVVNEKLHSGMVDMVSNFKKKVRAPLDIKVIQTIKELPDYIQENMKAENAEGSAGVFDPKTKTVYLISTNTKNLAEAEKALLHEAVAHYGLRNMLGREYNGVLESVYGSMNPRDILRLQDLYKTKNTHVIADEYIAEMAEANVKPGFVKRAIAKIRELIRKVFNIKVSDGDIYAMLLKSKKYLSKKQAMFAGHLLDPSYMRRKQHEGVQEVDDVEELGEGYDTLEDIWIGNKDIKKVIADNSTNNLQKQIQAVYKNLKPRNMRSWKDADKAIHVYLDMQGDPDAATLYWDKLSVEQKRIVKIAENLPQEMLDIASKLREQYDKIGDLAYEKGVIHNLLDNYVARAWDIQGKKSTDLYTKFFTKTRHSKQRVLGSIIEGWSKGLNLKIEGATSNLGALKKEIYFVIENNKLIDVGMKLKSEQERPLFSTKQLDGYMLVKNPSFKKWVPRKDYKFTEEEKKFGSRNVVITDEGLVLVRSDIYAPADVAKKLNAILEDSRLKGVPGFDGLTRFNANLKKTILSWSFFHHQAFIRSYLFGGAVGAKDLNPFKAYKEGYKAFRELGPDVQRLIRNGLTTGTIQDWDESLTITKGKLGRMLDNMNVAPGIRSKIRDIHEAHTNFLFGKFGTGLKIKAALLEYQQLIKKYPNKHPDELAKQAAILLNEDFGGLHLDRMHRNKTMQHIFRLTFLAPDWTESNVRTMVRAFERGEGGHIYRRFWTRILTRGAFITVALNMLSALPPDEDNEKYLDRLITLYKKAFEHPKRLNWLSVDITPLYELLTGKDDAEVIGDKRKYFNILGHFKDPYKFIVYPVRSVKNKSSVIMKMALDAVFGTNWQGKRYTSVSEFIGVDGNGKYSTSSKEKGYRVGEQKGGKLTGQLTKWSPTGKKGPISWEEMPSYIMYQLKGWMPIPMQNIVSYTMGDIDGFDAISHGLGIHVNTANIKDDDISKKYKEASKKADITYRMQKDAEVHEEFDKSVEMLEGVEYEKAFIFRIERSMIRDMEEMKREALDNANNVLVKELQAMIDAKMLQMVEDYYEEK